MHISLRKFRPFTRKNRSDKRSNIVGLVLFIHFLLPPDLMKLLNRLNRSFLTYCRASCTCVVVLTLIKLTRTYIIYLYTHSKRVRVLIYSLIIIQYFHKYTRSRWTRAAWCLVVIIYIYIFVHDVHNGYAAIRNGKGNRVGQRPIEYNTYIQTIFIHVYI